ncbi:MAG: type I-U CRISPR-associated protein Cas7 [Bryobacterales bacterium]|nr:type I-U CRISPR-associated protein Cas7 [Bryobacterales bacterium]
MTYNDLASAVRGNAAALRSRTTLQPVGGVGDKVFPVTFKGGLYATENRKENPLDHGSRKLECVLLDSVAAQANRAEEALLRAVRAGRLELPLIEVDFSEANESLPAPIPNLTSLEVPHRLADAILRDCNLPGGERFSRSAYAREWARASAWNATPVYRFCPTALLFGMWGSPDKPGGLGAKFERAFVSEIVGVDIERSERRAGFRVDPLGVSSKVTVLPDEQTGGFEFAEPKTKNAVAPSSINHGNIIYESLNSGVRFAYAEQTTVVSLGALRKLRFPIDGRQDPVIDDAGRTVLAALGICAGTLASERELSLRSRCHLWPTERRQWELLEVPGMAPGQHEITSEAALEMVVQAQEAARALGLVWESNAIRLTPTPELVELVRRSQEVVARSSEGDSQ